MEKLPVGFLNLLTCYEFAALQALAYHTLGRWFSRQELYTG